METDSAASGAGSVGGVGGGTGGVAITEIAPTQTTTTMRLEEAKPPPPPSSSSTAVAPDAKTAGALVAASATATATITPSAEEQAIDATTYGIQQQLHQQPPSAIIGATEQQQQQPQTQPLMLKVTGATKDKEKTSHKRKKTMDSTCLGPPPTAIVKAENTPDVSVAAAVGDLRDDDDDNDEDDDRLLMQEYDPERLKAFNMFVRLFVDENLDRVAPISKQPKEKIQAILEACDRQFPEFHHRSRKRIRTYLKSCRRMRRSKGVGDGKQIRPTLPHLTSAAAETILARACENESNNAKRMRMGLEPLPATEMVIASGQTPAPPALPPHPPPPPPAPPAPAAPPAPTPPTPIPPQPIPNSKSTPRSKMSLSPNSSSAASAAITPGIPLPLQKPLELTSQTGSRASPQAHAQSKPPLPIALDMAHSSPMRQPSPKVAHRPVEQDHVMMQSATLRGGGGALPESELPLAYVTNGSGAKAHVGHAFENEIRPFQSEAYPGSTSSVLPSNEQQQNGPTDLSMKKETMTTSQGKSQLNPEEVATIKQLIAGYRESAAFLCRSADELQQLIMQHN